MVAPRLSVIDIEWLPSADDVYVNVFTLDPLEKDIGDVMKLPPLSEWHVTVSEPERETAVTVKFVDGEPVIPALGPDKANALTPLAGIVTVAAADWPVLPRPLTVTVSV